MRRIPFALLALIPLVTAAPGRDSRTFEMRVFLDGATQYRPPVEFLHEMSAPALEVVLHLEFKSGLYRVSKTGKTRGTTGGVYLEANDAEAADDDPKNPYRPIPFEPYRNGDWHECVAPDFPYPNPAPGYWYTFAGTGGKLKRDLRIALSEPQRLRIRIRGVAEEIPSARRVPTLVAITELGIRDGTAPLPAPPAPPPPPPAPPPLQRASLEFPGVAGLPALLQLERESPARVRPGELFDVTLRVRNLTQQSLSRIAVVESGAGEFQVESAPEEVDRGEEGLLVWRIATLGPGGTAEARLSVRASAEGVAARRTTISLESAPLESASPAQ